MPRETCSGKCRADAVRGNARNVGEKLQIAAEKGAIEERVAAAEEQARKSGINAIAEAQLRRETEAFEVSKRNDAETILELQSRLDDAAAESVKAKERSKS